MRLTDKIIRLYILERLLQKCLNEPVFVCVWRALSFITFVCLRCISYLVPLNRFFNMFAVYRLSNVPKTVSHYDLYTAFSRCGRVEDIVRGRGRGAMLIIYRKYKILDCIRPQLQPQVVRLHIGVTWLRSRLYTKNACRKYLRKMRVARTLLAAPPADSPHNMLNALNDDCLDAIFRYEKLSAQDMYEISRVCSRFRRVVQNVCRTKYASTKGLVVATNHIPLWELEQCLMLVGASMQSMGSMRSQHPDLVMRLIARHCPKALALYSVLYSPILDSPLGGLARRLQVLRLGPLHSACVHYQVLSLPAVRCPQLTELHLSNVQLPDRANTMHFADSNPQLAKLVLHNVELCMPIDQLIAKWPHMRELAVRGRAWIQEFAHLGTAAGLRTLYLGYDMSTALYILCGLRLDVVESLTLEQLTVNTFLLDMIMMQRHLKSLRLLHNQIYHEQHLIGIVQLLPLDSFELSSSLIGVDAIRDILSVPHRLQRATFECHTSSISALRHNYGAYLEEIAKIAEDRECKVAINIRNPYQVFETKTIKKTDWCRITISGQYRTTDTDLFI